MRKETAAFSTVMLIMITTLLGAAQTDVLPLGDSPHRYQPAALAGGLVMHTADGRSGKLEEFADLLRPGSVYIIGEYHDSFACHEFQSNLLKMLAERFGNKIVVGFEFFRREDDPALADFLAGRLDREGLVRASGWYRRSSQPFLFTATVLETVRENGLRAIGLNVEREIVRRVSRQGFSSLSRAEQKLFPFSEVANPGHRFYIQQMFGNFGALIPAWFENVYQAQVCWDTYMADSMRRFLERPENKGYTGVIIAGSAHVAYGLGIPFRYRLGDRRRKLVSLVPAALKPAAEEAGDHPMLRRLAAGLQAQAVFSRGLADFVFSIDRDLQPPFPRPGLSARDVEGGGAAVTAVSPDSPAAAAGLAPGDIILEINGEQVNSAEDLYLMLDLLSFENEPVFTLKKKMPLKQEKGG